MIFFYRGSRVKPCRSHEATGHVRSKSPLTKWGRGDFDQQWDSTRRLKGNTLLSSSHLYPTQYLEISCKSNSRKHLIHFLPNINLICHNYLFIFILVFPRSMKNELVPFSQSKGFIVLTRRHFFSRSIHILFNFSCVSVKSNWSCVTLE